MQKVVEGREFEPRFCSPATAKLRQLIGKRIRIRGGQGSERSGMGSAFLYCAQDTAGSSPYHLLHPVILFEVLGVEYSPMPHRLNPYDRTLDGFFNPIALRTTRTLKGFGRSECNRAKGIMRH